MIGRNFTERPENNIVVLSRRSSAAERGFHKAEVAGSNPAAGTNTKQPALPRWLLRSFY